MSRKLAGKVAVVTGASKGIGAGIAKAMAAEGASVVVNYASSAAGAERVVGEIVAAGGKGVAVQGDVSKPEDVKRLFEETKKAFGRLDVLVNNAGVFRFGPFEEISVDEFQRQYTINVLGPILATQEAIRQFGFEGGSVINVSSVVGSKAVPGGVLYSSTKGAVDNMTYGMAQELGPRRIRVNAVAPGPTESEGVESLGLFEGEQGKAYVSMTPLGRLGQPSDIASAVVFLASDDAAWVTGEVLRASGGLR